MDHQFYPTPLPLALKAWAKFKNRDYVRVMDPSAGHGHLLKGAPFLQETARGIYRRGEPSIVDCCEIDPTMHPVLREQGFNVVGLDFMEYSGGQWLSHIILNPPFLQGTEHVLKAWQILWDGEIVAIVNAETIRNPFSAQRQMLVRLIENFGEVEFVQDAFAGPDAERRTNVEVALIYLRKQADMQTDIIGDLLGELKKDEASTAGLASGFEAPQQLAIPNTSIENTVLAFNAAVEASRQSIFAGAKAAYYSRLLGRTLAEMSNEKVESAEPLTKYVHKTLLTNYLDLKARAWSSILRSTKVTSRLSSKAQQRLESEFESIKQLEFTVRNVYGFLCGLIDKQGEVMLDMACDVFDLATKYHSDNTVWYKGWKSNDRHRTCGKRMRTNRFILPGHGRESYQSSMGYDSLRLLGDFDKVFAMLDGKTQPEVSLVYLFDKHYRELLNGKRLSSSYFDVRYYPGAGTIHFFAQDKAIVDRLNRLVGRRRQWLPPDDKQGSEVFWKQYDQAEKLDKELRAEVTKVATDPAYKNHFGWAGPLSALNSPTEETRNAAMEVLFTAATTVLQKHDIDPDLKLGASGVEPGQLHLLLAA